MATVQSHISMHEKLSLLEVGQFINYTRSFTLICFALLIISSTAPGKPVVPISPATKPNTSVLYRGTASRSTFHGGPIRDRRQANYNGPGGLPMHSQDTSAMGTTGRFSIFNKLTSKFSRRYVPVYVST